MKEDRNQTAASSSFFVHRSTLKELLSYGIPSLTGYLVLSINDLVDMFWLGRLGTEPVAAVTIASTLLWVLLEFPGFTVGAGSVAIISRRFGEGDHEKTERAIRATFFTKVVLGVIFGMLGLLVMKAALAFLGAEARVLELAADFMVVLLVAAPFLHVSFSVFTVLRSIGKPKWAFWMQAVGVGLNIILAPLFIFGIGPFPEWGVFGAACATATAFGAVVVLGGWLLASERSPIRVHWFRRPLPAWNDVWPILKIGLPSGISSLSLALATTVAVKFVAHFGTEVVAFYGLGQRALEFGLTAMVGFGLGGSALIGQHIGAGRRDLAMETGRLGIHISLVTMFSFALVLLAGAPLVIDFFLPEAADTDAGATLLRILAVGLPFLGVTVGVETAFGGAGMNKPTMVLSLIRAWVLALPLMYFCGPLLNEGPVGLMWGRTLAFAIAGAASWWLFHRGGWLKHEV